MLPPVVCPQREMNIGYFNNELSSRIAKFFKYEVRDKGWFKGFIIGIIFLAGVLVGVQTYDMTDESALQIIGYAALAQAVGRTPADKLVPVCSRKSW